MYIRTETIGLRCLARSHTSSFCSCLCGQRAYPRWFLGRVGRNPLSHTLTRQRFKTPSRKGGKNHLYSTSLDQCHNILASSFFPFWHLLPMGEKFGGFNISSLSPCHSCLSTLVIYVCCMNKYIEKTTPSVCPPIYARKFKVHSHMHILWGSLLYILWSY